MINKREERGLWAEMTAGAWLVLQGYEVFYGSGNTSCDLIALMDGKATRVEVKAATPNTTLVPWYVANIDPESFDMLLVVLPDGTVLANPAESLVGRSRHPRIVRAERTATALKRLDP